MIQADKTALVTGANSGFGFSAAEQLANAGWGKVILACRSVRKSEVARRLLVSRTGRDPFDVLAVDTAEVDSARLAIEQLRRQGDRVNFLLLNAGASSPDRRFNSDGIELTYASTLIGHHVMTLRALAQGVLSRHARVVIAGSESARGDVPGETGHDVARIAAAERGGDLVGAIGAFLRLELRAQTPFKNMREYGTAKLFVAWWAAALARRMPSGMTVNAVSPGGALATRFGRDAPIALRVVVLPILRILAPLVGLSGSVEQGARRYLEAEAFTDDETGHFYATAARRKVIGRMAIQSWPEYFLDNRSHEACFEALVKSTGEDFPSEMGGRASV